MEELDTTAAPNDDEYDTDDSFIDDSEQVCVDIFHTFLMREEYFLRLKISYLCFFRSTPCRMRVFKLIIQELNMMDFISVGENDASF